MKYFEYCYEFICKASTSGWHPEVWYLPMMPVMAVVAAIGKLLRKLDPLLRLPFIFGLDVLIASLDFNNVRLLIWAFSVMTVTIPLFVLIRHEILCFIYSCCICLYIFIPTLSFTVGTYVPIVQNIILTIDSKVVISDALWCYLLILGVVSTMGKEMFIPRPFLLSIPMALSCTFGSYKFSWIFGYIFYHAGELLDIHVFIEKMLKEAVILVKLVGLVNTVVYYYRARKISTILRLFWILTVCNIVINSNTQLNVQWVLISVAASCNSSLRLFAMSLWLPEVSYALLWISRGFLGWTISHTVKDVDTLGMGQALVFCAIAFLNNMTHIGILERMFFLSVLMFISFSYTLQLVFTLVDGVLKSLSMTMQARRAAHVRALMLMLFLVWLLGYISYTFCLLFSFHVWQLVIVSSNIVTAVQALSSLAIYALFMYDSKVTINHIDDLDEWVYRITAFSNTSEFLSAFLVLSFGLWDVIKGSWNVAGLFIIIVHAYFNIWLKAREAWKIFLSRRSAVIKLNCLADATKEQLDDLKDLCAICFDAMVTAKITQCGHYFHAKCLRKWLYIQTTCPLCHQDVVMNSNRED